MRVDLVPARETVRIAAAIGRRDFQISGRLLSDLRNLDPRDEVGDLLVLDIAGAPADDKAADIFGTPRRVVERREAAAGNAEQIARGARNRP